MEATPDSVEVQPAVLELVEDDSRSSSGQQQGRSGSLSCHWSSHEMEDWK